MERNLRTGTIPTAPRVGSCCAASSDITRNGYIVSPAAYNGYSRSGAARTVNAGDMAVADQLPLTMAFVARQDWCNTFDTQTALCRGTLFPELHKPFYGSRGDR